MLPESLSLTEQHRLAEFAIYAAAGMAHILCVIDIWSAYADGKWGAFFRQLLIEVLLLFLTYETFVVDCARRFRP